METQSSNVSSYSLPSSPSVQFPAQESQSPKQVLDQLERFDRCQVRTRELIDLLEQSLTGVLRSMSDKSPETSTPREALVPVATEIQRYTDGQAQLNAQLDSILQRLEV